MERGAGLLAEVEVVSCSSLHSMFDQQSPESTSTSAKTPAPISTPSSTKLYKSPSSVQDPWGKSPSTPVSPVLSQLLEYPTPTRNTTKTRDKLKCARVLTSTESRTLLEEKERKKRKSRKRKKGEKRKSSKEGCKGR